MGTAHLESWMYGVMEDWEWRYKKAEESQLGALLSELDKEKYVKTKLPHNIS